LRVALEVAVQTGLQITCAVAAEVGVRFEWQLTAQLAPTLDLGTGC
jgi:hypothetical protein